MTFFSIERTFLRMYK